MKISDKNQATISALKPIAEIISIGIGVLSILLKDRLPVVFFIGVGIAVSVIILISVWSLIDAIRMNHYQKGDTSNISNKKIQSHLKSLYKLALKNEKDIQNDIFKRYAYNDEFMNSVLKGNVPAKKAKKYANYSQKDFIKLIEKDNAPCALVKDSTISNSTEEIIKCIKEIDHIMLSTAQLRYRVKLGSYIERYYCSYWDKIKAQTDMLGWTYVLMGNVKKAEKVLHSTIKELTEFSKNEEKMKDNNDFYNCHLYLSRLHRHLAAAAPIRRRDFEEALEQVGKAYSELDTLRKAFEKDNAILTGNQIKDLERNRLGVIFGYVETYYDQARSIQKSKTKGNAKNVLLSSIKYLNILLESMNDLDSTDPHRATNVRIMHNKIFFVAQQLFRKGENADVDKMMDAFVDENSKERSNSQLDKNLCEIKNVLAKSIYVDQAVESYIQQRIFQTYKTVGANNNIYYGREDQ